MPKARGVTKKGSRFYGFVDFGGRRYTPGGRGFATASEASAWREQKRAELKSWHQPDRTLTVAQVAAQYLVLLKERSRESTVRHAVSVINTHIIPGFGASRVVDVSLGDVERFRSTLLAKYSPGYTKRIMEALRRLFDRAVKHSIIDKNPARMLDPLRRVRQEKRILTVEQIRLLLGAAPPREKCIIAIALFSGLRRGEVLGLQWSDIDLPNKLITVKRQVVRGKVTEPKTRGSAGTIPYIGDLQVILYQWQQRGGTGWLFPSPEKGGPLHPDTWLGKHFIPLVRKLGLDGITFHSCRHTFVSLALQRGVAVSDVMRWARHSSLATTSVYAHSDDVNLRMVASGVSFLNESNVEENVEY